MEMRMRVVVNKSNIDEFESQGKIAKSLAFVSN
jgi:hypothetical protein